MRAPVGGTVVQAGVVPPKVHEEHGVCGVAVAIPLHLCLDAIRGLRRHRRYTCLVLQQLAGGLPRGEHRQAAAQPPAVGQAQVGGLVAGR